MMAEFTQAAANVAQVVMAVVLLVQIAQAGRRVERRGPDEESPRTITRPRA